MKKHLLVLFLLLFAGKVLFGQVPLVVPVITSFSPGSGAIGSMVTINGSNLDAPKTFTIGGKSPIIISNTGTQIVAYIMPGTITGRIAIANNDAGFNTTANFTITQPSPPSVQQGNKFSASDATGKAQQGIAVAVSADGNTAIVGASADNTSQGAAFIYARVNGTWVQQGGKLVGTGAVGRAGQGSAVALSADGNTAVVGGMGDNNLAGAVWVYTRTNGVWTQQGDKLVGTGAVGNAEQGCSVGLSADGNTLIFGGLADNNSQGAAWVFIRYGGGSLWFQIGDKLVGTNAVQLPNQGASVALSADGTAAIVGGPGDNNAKGAFWFYNFSGSYFYQYTGKFTVTGNVGQARVGTSVALNADGTTAVIGGNSDNSGAGAAWIYTLDSFNAWHQQGTKLTGTGGTGAGGQGNSVAVSADGSTILSAAYADNNYQGAGWLFTRSGTTWTQQGNKLTGSGSAGQPNFGNSVSMSADGKSVIVGGPGDNSSIGAAWVYTSPASANASLSLLSATTGFSQAFSSGNLTYTATVGSGVTTVSLTPIVNDINATIKINGVDAKSGLPSTPVSLTINPTIVNVVVTAENGNTQTYSLTVTKQPSPVITSFSPISGGIGTIVTITGANFDPVPANNIVFFGAVKANVVSATASSVVVTVPAGANYSRISLSTNNMAALSSKPFIVTYPNGIAAFQGGNAFPSKFDLMGASTNKYAAASTVADFDGDGKPDLAVLDGHSSVVSIYKNNGSQTAPFTNTPDLNLQQAGTGYITIADFDGDGKPDIATLSGGYLAIYKNTSTAGNLSFSAVTPISAGVQTLGMVVGDFDGDGKIDIATANDGNNTFSILLNTTSGGNISFAPRQEFPTGGNPYGIATGDIDGDGKLDIVTANHVSYTVSVIRNNSTPGNLAFDTKIDYSLGTSPQKVFVADLDGDGKPDIITSNHLDFGNETQGSHLLNVSTSGNVSFQSATTYSNGPFSDAGTIADINGDGKPDLLLADKQNNNAAVFDNQSTSGAISLGGGIAFSNLSYPSDVMVGDFNSDGKPDIAISNSTSGALSIYINQLDPLSPTISSFTPQQAGQGTAVTMTGTNFTGATEVDFGGKAATSFTVVSPTTITAVVDAGNTGYITVTTPKGSATATQFVFVNKPAIGTVVVTTSGANYQVVISGLYLDNPTAVSFNGIPAISFSFNSTTGKITAITATNTFNTVSVTTIGGTTNYGLPPTVTAITPTSAQAGSTVTITGTNFTGATAVTFGGTAAASFVVNSATSISAVIGTGASGDVVVTTPNGKGTLSNKFNFIGQPTITSFTPTSAKAGATVTLTGTNFSGATSVTFGGVTAASASISSSTSITAVISTGGASGNVAVTTPGGTTSLAGFTFIPASTITSYSPTTAATGATVTITGTNFTGATAVSFGGTAATSFTVVSATSITAVVAKGSSGNISVTTPGGSVMISGFTYISSIPTITSFTPTSALTGTTVTITGTNFTGATAVTFGGTAAASYTVVSATSITAVVASGTSGNVVVTTPSGTGSLAGFSFVGTPTIAAGGSTTIIFGGSVTLSTGTATGYTYQWTKDGVNITGATSASYNATQSGAYAVVVTVNGVSQTSAATTVTVIAAPTITAGGPTTFVTGSAVPLTANPSTGYIYQWLKDGVNITGATSATYTATQAGSYTVTISLNSISQTSLATIVTVVPPPTITAGGSTTIIAGGSVTLSTGTGTGYTYQWIKDGAIISGATAASYNATQAGAYNVIITVNGVSIVSSATTVVLTPVPTITASGSTTIGTGGSVGLTASPATGYSYQWLKDGVAITGATLATYTATQAGAYSVAITLNSISQTSLPITVSTVFALPAGNFKITANSATCHGSANGSITIIALQNLSYTVTITGGSVHGLYSFNVGTTISNLAAGAYNVCFTVAGQISYSQCFTIVITEPKDLAVYAAVNNTIQSVNLTLDGGSTYYVTLNGVTTTTTANNITLALNKGINDITVTTDKPCQGTYQKRIDLSPDVLAYPNPFASTLNVNLGTDNLPVATIELYNTAGVRVYSKQFTNASGEVQLTPGNLAPGMYMLKLSAGQLEKIIKVVKQ